VNPLDDIYRLLGTPRTQAELADDYRTALLKGASIAV
jgi:hypothetical protein